MVNGKPITYTKSCLEEVGFVTEKMQDDTRVIYIIYIYIYIYLYSSRLKKLPLKDASRFYFDTTRCRTSAALFLDAKKVSFSSLGSHSVVGCLFGRIMAQSSSV